MYSNGHEKLATQLIELASKVDANIINTFLYRKLTQRLILDYGYDEQINCPAMDMKNYKMSS